MRVISTFTGYGVNTDRARARQRCGVEARSPTRHARLAFREEKTKVSFPALPKRPCHTQNVLCSHIRTKGNEVPNLTYQQLREATVGGAVALRSRTILQPAGGEGDKVFPPTYAVSSGHKYAIEERQIGDSDKTTTTVLLDSVASQANRAEAALLSGWESGRVEVPGSLR